MKRREYVDGCPQQEYITKEETSSPTVSSYTLMGSFVTDAVDGRKVIIVNMPDTFLQSNWPEDEYP